MCRESRCAPDDVAMAKIGRRCTLDATWLGSGDTKCDIRDRERSARKHGDASTKIARLREYPDTVAAYIGVLRLAFFKAKA